MKKLDEEARDAMTQFITTTYHQSYLGAMLKGMGSNYPQCK